MERMRKALKRHYDLEVCEILPLEHGLWEESFKVQTGNTAYYVKRFWRKHRLATRYEEMQRGVALGETLRQSGFPVPELIYTKDGSCFAHFEGEVYQVNAWVTGTTYHPGTLPPEGARAMGALLATFHSRQPIAGTTELRVPTVKESLEGCMAVRLKYEGQVGKFPAYAREILDASVQLLGNLPKTYGQGEQLLVRTGTVFNSFWVEQVLFNDDLAVVALVDWTDGAGRTDALVRDIDTAVYVSAFGVDETVQFLRGYQSVLPLLESEWRALKLLLGYRQLGETWVYEAWLAKTNRRMAHWETIAAKWLSETPKRFKHSELIDAAQCL